MDFRGLTGDVIVRGAPLYEQARQEWNRAIQAFPLVIVYCGTKVDVSNAIRWARKYDVAIRIRSGGHNYEGYSVGNNVIVIDVSRLNSVTIDVYARTITVGGGAKNKDLYEMMSAKGYPFPGGTCPTVGLSGYVLGGGWGYSCRYYGLGCDQVLEFELVNYKGEIIKANAYTNPDLFWACRGAGGGNFGVVVSMTLRLPKKTSYITLLEVYYENASMQVMEQFLETWQRWLPALDRRMTMNARLYNSSEEGMAIFGRGFFYGSEEEAKALLRPFYMIPGASIIVKTKPFLEAVYEVGSFYPDSEKFKSTGRFVHRLYTKTEITNLIKIIQQRPVGSVLTSLGLYALGGKVKDVGKHQTAYYYRDAEYILGFQSVWEEDRYAADNQAWVLDRLRYIKSITTGSYVNFPISPLPHYETEYFGENAAMLRKVNAKYDPLQVFQFPQSVRSDE